GLVVDIYQKTPNSGGYYRANAAYWPNGLANRLNLYKNDGITALMPTFTYTPEGEGRVDTVSASTSPNPVTGTAYNDLYGRPTSVTFGTSDSDVFTYDANTGRMTQYKFNIASPVQSVIGNLARNQDGTLKELAISDLVTSLTQPTCAYGFDEVARLL